jgi:pimeloyl-ACP methyl ester carboxylesterase
MTITTHPRRHVRWALAVLVALAVLGGSAVDADAASTKPTVVLVHGAFADASGWNGVTERLQERGYDVVAPANPLRGVASDAAYLRGYLSTLKGPIVLVGHSYGGVVITNAATGNPNVKALVYVAAYAPDAGDTVVGLNGLGGGGGMIGPATLDLHPFIAPDGTEQAEGTIKTAVFRRIFAADVPRKLADAMAVSQRPGAVATLSEPSGPPAWRSVKSWYLVAGRDLAIGTGPEKAMARRIGAVTTVLRGASHVPMVSRPDAVTRFILRATR